MKKYEITISGYGVEVVVGTLTKEQHEKIISLMEENDMDELYEFYNDSDLVEEADVKEWYENDSRFHLYSPFIDESSKITVTELDTNEEILEKPITKLSCLMDGEWDEQYYEIGESLMFCGVAEDKGVTFSSTIEIEGEFDESKLKIFPVELILESYRDMELFTKIEYDGEEIHNEDSSTDGKSFDVEILE